MRFSVSCPHATNERGVSWEPTNKCAQQVLPHLASTMSRSFFVTIFFTARPPLSRSAHASLAFATTKVMKATAAVAKGRKRVGLRTAPRTHHTSTSTPQATHDATVTTRHHLSEFMVTHRSQYTTRMRRGRRLFHTSRQR